MTPVRVVEAARQRREAQIDQAWLTGLMAQTSKNFPKQPSELYGNDEKPQALDAQLVAAAKRMEAAQQAESRRRNKDRTIFREDT